MNLRCRSGTGCYVYFNDTGKKCQWVPLPQACLLQESQWFLQLSVIRSRSKDNGRVFPDKSVHSPGPGVHICCCVSRQRCNRCAFSLTQLHYVIAAITAVQGCHYDCARVSQIAYALPVPGCLFKFSQGLEKKNKQKSFQFL